MDKLVPFSLEEFKRWGSLFGCVFFERKEDVESSSCLEDFFGGWIYIVFFLPTFWYFFSAAGLPKKIWGFPDRHTARRTGGEHSHDGSCGWRCFFGWIFSGPELLGFAEGFGHQIHWLKSLGHCGNHERTMVSFNFLLEKVNTKYWLSQMVMKDGDFHPMGSWSVKISPKETNPKTEELKPEKLHSPKPTAGTWKYRPLKKRESYWKPSIF